MKFWDSSAVVPLVIDEASSPTVRAWLKADPHQVFWALTGVELASAIERRVREGALDRSDRSGLLVHVRRLAADATEVADIASVRTLATSLLARHPLRAADALQLAAALVVAAGDPASWTFVVLDRRLADAAEREGFQVLTTS